MNHSNPVYDLMHKKVEVVVTDGRIY